MNELQIYNYNDKQVRTVEKDGEPWFVLKDVCAILGLSNNRIVADRLDQDEVSQTYVTDSIGRQQETTIINESGLYNVILRSDKPEAKPFRKWVTSEVLPSIRKHGAYMTHDTVEKILTDPDTIIMIATQFKEEREARIRLEEEVEKNKHKVLFADSVSASSTSIPVGDLAKLIKQNGYDIGQNRLFAWMRSKGYLMKNGARQNMPTQWAMDMGLFQIQESTVSDAEGNIHIARTARVTGKGQVYFLNYFLEPCQVAFL